MRNISQKSLLQVLLPDTEFGEQATAVGRFREVSQALERIEAELRRAEIRHNSLRRSLLGAAFSGRLTGHANDSDQIEELASTKAIRKGRGNDA